MWLKNMYICVVVQKTGLVVEQPNMHDGHSILEGSDKFWKQPRAQKLQARESKVRLPGRVQVLVGLLSLSTCS